MQGAGMTVTIRDDVLRRAAEDPGFTPPGWSDQVLALFRKRVHRLDAVYAEEDLTQLRSIGARRNRGEGFSIDLGGVVVAVDVVSTSREGPVEIAVQGFVVVRKETVT